MGNRSYVIFPAAKVAVYLHWNGSIESVVAFLDYMNERGLGAENYGAARFCQVVGNFFGGNLSLGVCGASGTENGNDGFRALSDEDNGAFVVADHGGANGLHIAQWWKRGKRIEPAKLADAITAARVHAYNANGELLAGVREKNTPAPAKAEA